MRQLPDKFYRFSCNFIQVLTLAFTGLLFVSGFLFTCYADDMTSQQVRTAVDNPLLTLPGTALLLLFLIFCCRLAAPAAASPDSESPAAQRISAKRKRILLALVLGWIVLLGGILILFGRTAPAADAWSVYSAAASLSEGDASVIHPTDSYLSYYPQQVGLLAFFELLIRLWKLLPTDLQAYHFIKCLYVVLTCVIVFYQYAAVRLLWRDDRTECAYLVMAGANLPLILYSSFVYGEIPSFAALSVGVYYLLRILCPGAAEGGASDDGTARKHGMSRREILWGAVSVLSLAISVMLRKNSLVILIAVLIVTVLEGMKRRRKDLLVLAALCAALSLTILPATQKMYELRAGNTLRSGVPAMSYFAMGMQESSRGNGWYNGFNFDTYQESGMDTDAAADASRQVIAERISYFREHPDYALSFYLGKFLSQWADGTYASRQATLATLGERHPLVESVYTGKVGSFYIGWCNLYQNLLYLGCFLGIFTALLRGRTPALYTRIGLIGAFGGFLFHMIWEANARYIFLYGLLLLPYAARGIAGLSRISNTFLPGKSHRNNTDHRQDATQKPPTAA
ncbi:MAG: hypothetical protein NC399_00455 [Muribaculum sp.]|nr:hypothetical protein [Muribaculum sp.]